ncbi:MAG: extensin family protein [Beijerinckiaceae bacterium]
MSVQVTVLALLGLAAAGCSRQGQKEQRAEWRSAAEKACLRSGSVKETPYIKVAKALEGPGSCGADHPFKVSAFTTNLDVTASAPGLFRSGGGGLLTKLNQEGTMTCPMVAGINNWLEKVVQPAAMARFGQNVVELRIMGTYSCRRMNNGGYSARMSEHAFANAIDIGGFRLADGSIVSILKGWNGPLEEQNFLREVHAGACSHFATVLGPGVALHHDHLHFDLARHGRRGDRSICRPYPQPVAPPNPGLPYDPAKTIITSDARNLPPREPDRQAYAMAQRPIPLPPANVASGPILPGYRPQSLPAAPRNPVAEREEAEHRAAPPRTARPVQPSGPPVMLYGRGRGPFLPLREEEIDPQDLDEVTGSVGE